MAQRTAPRAAGFRMRRRAAVFLLETTGVLAVKAEGEPDRVHPQSAGVEPTPEPGEMGARMSTRARLSETAERPKMGARRAAGIRIGEARAAGPPGAGVRPRTRVEWAQRGERAAESEPEPERVAELVRAEETEALLERVARVAAGAERAGAAAPVGRR